MCPAVDYVMIFAATLDGRTTIDSFDMKEVHLIPGLQRSYCQRREPLPKRMMCNFSTLRRKES
jgi:hypothetical protein